MKYWRKMLLAVFAVCLFAGVGFGECMLPGYGDSIPKNGAIYIGNWNVNPDDCGVCTCGDNCDVREGYPLDVSIWDCDMSKFWNGGFCQLDFAEYDGMNNPDLPHQIAWSESRKMLFIAYQDSHMLDIVDFSTVMPDGSFKKMRLPLFDDEGEDEEHIGSITVDDENGRLFVSKLDSNNDPYCFIFYVDDFCCTTSPACGQPFSLCCDCGDVGLSEPLDIEYHDGKLYVTYNRPRFPDGSLMGNSRIGVFDVSVSGGSYSCVDTIAVVCDPDEPVDAVNLAVETDDGNLLIATTKHGGEGMTWEKVCLGNDGGTVDDLEKMGIVQMTSFSPSGVKHSTCIDLNAYDLQGTLLECDLDERIIVDGVAINPGDCEDCMDGIVYLTGKRGRIASSSGQCCWKMDWQEGLLIALRYVIDPDTCEVVLTYESVKKLCDEWCPGDIVATKWVPEFQVKKTAVDGVFEVDMEVLVDGNVMQFTERFDEDGIALDLAAATVSVNGTNPVQIPQNYDDSVFGLVTWEDFLDEFAPFQAGDEVFITIPYTVIADGTFTNIASVEWLSTICPCGPLFECGCPFIASGWECVTGEETPTPTPPCPTPCCAELLEEDDDAYPSDFGIYDGNFWVFQVMCTGDVAPDAVGFSFDEADGAVYDMVEWDGAQWLAMVAEVTWSDGDTEMLVSGDFVCDAVYAMVEEGGLADLNADDNDSGGGGDPVLGNSSSGCNVGFSAAALLFAIPLVSIFRKR